MNHGQTAAETGKRKLSRVKSELPKNYLLTQPELARAIGGLNRHRCAQFLIQLDYWISRSGQKRPRGGDHLWIYNTAEQWAAQFECSTRTVERTFAKLKSLGLIQIAQLAKSKWDRKNFYTINEQAVIDLLRSRQSDGIDPDRVTDSLTENTDRDYKDSHGEKNIDKQAEVSKGTLERVIGHNCQNTQEDQKPREKETKFSSPRVRTENDVKDGIKQIPMARVADALGESIGTKGDSKGCIRCPWHDDEHPSLLVGSTNENRHRAYCRGCKHSEDQLGLVQKILHLSFPEALEWFYENMRVKRPTPKKSKAKVMADDAALKVLKDHGIEQSEAKQRRDFFYSAHYGGSWCWVVPTGHVHRAVRPKIVDGKAQRYFNRRGTRNCFYRAGNPDAESIVLTGGLFDALAVNIKTGFNAWSTTCGEGSLPENWELDLRNVDPIFICFDNDAAGKRGAERIACHLKHLGKTVRFVHLPVEYKDVGEFFAAGHTGEEFKALVANAKSNPQDKTWEPKKPVNPIEEWLKSAGASC